MNLSELIATTFLRAWRRILLYLEQLRKSNLQLERNDAAKIAYPPARNNIDTREEERASKTISRGQKQAELDRYVP